MAVNTTTIEGFVHQANGAVREKSFVIFETTGFDVDKDNGAAIASTAIRAPIAADGSISQELWPTEDGVRGVYYHVTYEIYNGVNSKLINGGNILVPTSGGPYNLGVLTEAFFDTLGDDWGFVTQPATNFVDYGAI